MIIGNKNIRTNDYSASQHVFERPEENQLPRHIGKFHGDADIFSSLSDGRKR